jgi:hypothetical protein
LLHYLQKGYQNCENLDTSLNFQQLGKAAIANAVFQMNGRLNKAIEEPDVKSVASDSDESMETTATSLSLKERLEMARSKVLESNKRLKNPTQFQFEECSERSASRNGNF